MMNIVPKQGGNRMSGCSSWPASEGMQANNFTEN